ncbi:hypothetical protein KSP39_PZI020523 [Platanthera zijinensis]|uniref:Uncharacterized protein n=1 Tax=Platanthera zijinensis TaxID=2320716 RepID=A0AAP0B132_9ASPA
MKERTWRKLVHGTVVEITRGFMGRVMARSRRWPEKRAKPLVEKRRRSAGEALETRRRSAGNAPEKCRSCSASRSYGAIDASVILPPHMQNLAGGIGAATATAGTRKLSWSPLTVSRSPLTLFRSLSTYINV